MESGKTVEVHSLTKMVANSRDLALCNLMYVFVQILAPTMDILATTMFHAPR